MRTWPRSLSLFHEIVHKRGDRLRELRFKELEKLDFPTESVTVGSRPATINTIVQHRADGRIRVVVQGFMKARLLGSHVALDGFHKYPDEAIAPMPEKEFYEFD